jgi:hypothetical protein
MRTWQQIEEVKALEKTLAAKTRRAMQALKRLDLSTPDKARNEQGWTPELLAAYRRYRRVADKENEHWHLEGKTIEAEQEELRAKLAEIESEQT